VIYVYELSYGACVHLRLKCDGGSGGETSGVCLWYIPPYLQRFILSL